MLRCLPQGVRGPSTAGSEGSGDRPRRLDWEALPGRVALACRVAKMATSLLGWCFSSTALHCTRHIFPSPYHPLPSSPG